MKSLLRPSSRLNRTEFESRKTIADIMPLRISGYPTSRRKLNLEEEPFSHSLQYSQVHSLGHYQVCLIL